MARQKIKKETPAAPAAAAAAATNYLAKKRIGMDLVEDISEANKRHKKIFDEVDAERDAEINKIEGKQKPLLDRLAKLKEEKTKTAAANGNVDVSDADDDCLHINAGGKIIAAKRGTLTQLLGSRLEALFSGRWDKKLPRDSSGRVFLDVNGDCFQAIVDYLNELAISSEDNEPKQPTVDDELEHILAHQLDVFGLTVDQPIGSSIVTCYSDEMILQEWLKEAGSGGELELLYRSSRDGLTSKNFHSKCDKRGPTVVIIETTEGGVVGGYTNTSWNSSGNNQYFACADKAFLFALSGFGLPSPCKMKLKNASGQHAIRNYSSAGPSFGSNIGLDLDVKKFSVSLSTGRTYEQGPSRQLYGAQARNYDIKEMEVFRVTNKPVSLENSRKKQSFFYESAAVEKAAPVDKFCEKVNNAINEKWTTFHELEFFVPFLEERFKDEEKFIESFGSGDTNDIVSLNVSGTMMATSRATLLLCEDSMLAKLFDDSKWTAQGCTSLARVKDWSPEEVVKWAKNINNIQEDVSPLFEKENINGAELLALNESVLERIGVKRVGTICLLMKEIKQLEEASQDTATLIEYSPYCFGKILDYLRLKRLYSLGLTDEPALPVVCESQKSMFEKVVKFYFPGECSKFILG